MRCGPLTDLRTRMQHPRVVRVTRAIDDPLAANPAAHAMVTVQRVIRASARNHDLRQPLRRQRDVAEDIVQDTFLRPVREVQEGRHPDNVRAWLYRVASNLVIGRSRRIGSAVRYLGRFSRVGSAEAADEGLLRRELDERVRSALLELRPEARIALVLASRGLTGAEIAAAIGRSESTTRSLLCRARQRLRDRLETMGERT
jgi:RNA polymerase sigma factor (sigma-70 family)